MDLHSFRGSIKNDVFLQPDNKFNINHSKIQYLKAIIIEKLAESFGAIHALELMVNFKVNISCALLSSVLFAMRLNSIEIFILWHHPIG